MLIVKQLSSFIKTVLFSGHQCTSMVLLWCIHYFFRQIFFSHLFLISCSLFARMYKKKWTCRKLKISWIRISATFGTKCHWHYHVLRSCWGTMPKWDLTQLELFLSTQFLKGNECWFDCIYHCITSNCTSIPRRPFSQLCRFLHLCHILCLIIMKKKASS